MLEHGKLGYMNGSTVKRLLLGYSQLRPKSLAPLISARDAVRDGADPRAAVEEAFLADPGCYRVARGPRTIAEVAAATRLSATCVVRFEQCQLSYLSRAKVALLAVYYSTLEMELPASLAHILPVPDKESAHGDSDGSQGT